MAKKIDVTKATSEMITQIIEIETDKELVNALGFKFALPLLDEDGSILTIVYHGKAPKVEKEEEYLGANLWRKPKQYFYGFTLIKQIKKEKQNVRS